MCDIDHEENAREWWVEERQGKMKRTKRDQEEKNTLSQRVKDKTYATEQKRTV